MTDSRRTGRQRVRTVVCSSVLATPGEPPRARSRPGVSQFTRHGFAAGSAGASRSAHYLQGPIHLPDKRWLTLVAALLPGLLDSSDATPR